MKKNGLAAVVVLLMVLVYSCARDKAQVPVISDCAAYNADSLKYSTQIKPIIDYNCVSVPCHSVFGATAADGIDLSNYSGAKDAFISKSAICAIQWGSSCEAMPQARPKMADSLITKLVCWTNAGCPQ